jgi:hypothetical protein
MGLFIPRDISQTIRLFMAKKTTLPLIERNDLMAVFYLFGRKYGVNGDNEIMNARDLAKKTMEQVSNRVTTYARTDKKLDKEMLDQELNKRSMQILVEFKNNTDSAFDFNEMVTLDPSILSECYTWHIAHFQSDFFFTLFGPLDKKMIPQDLHSTLENRMLLLGFNVQDASKLNEAPLNLFVRWIRSKSRA